MAFSFKQSGKMKGGDAAPPLYARAFAHLLAKSQALRVNKRRLPIHHHHVSRSGWVLVQQR
jgi:hypothetical protein